MRKLLCKQGHEMEMRDAGLAGKQSACGQCNIEWQHISVHLSSGNAVWAKDQAEATEPMVEAQLSPQLGSTAWFMD